jgi:lysyl-tRNA synthetase class 2
MSTDLPAPETLRRRAVVLRSLRATLDHLGFVEVETPVRIPAPANELHIEAPPSGRAFLRASPELQMKRLLCAGHDRIYQLGPCFREGERGQRHNPEFTMLEWYRAHAGADDVLRDLEIMVATAAQALHGGLRFTCGGSPVDVATPWHVLTVRDAFAGWDPVARFDADRFDHDMAFKVEPALPRDRPCVLRDYPAAAAALSRLCPADPRVAERWELYLGGIELCNAFGELTDAREQRARFVAAAEARRLAGATAYPLDEDFLAALGAGMPPAGGAALGVDRLCMVLLDVPDIAAVRACCAPVGHLW